MSFKALKVWRALKRKPGLTNRGLRQELGWTEASVAHILLNLEKWGCAVQEGKSWQRKWWAIGEAPKDRRGTDPASQTAIKPYQHFAVARLAKANYAQGRRVKHPKPKPTTELERCWGFAAVPVRFGQDE